MIYHLLVLISISIELIRSNECPLFEKYENPRIYQNYSVRSFVRIPKTNIVLINTIDHSTELASLVFYNDISIPSGKVINVVRPDYVIQFIDYIPSREKILIVNYEKIIIADLFTLKIIDSITTGGVRAGYMIQDTNFAIMMNNKNFIYIFDTISVQFITTLNIQYDAINGADVVLSTTKSYYFKCQKPLVILISTQKNILVWSFDYQKLDSEYHGLLDYSNHTMLPKYRRITKHSTEDIIFITGDYYQIIALKVISFKDKQYKKLMEINLYDKTKANIITNIQFIYVQKDKNKVPTLILSETQNLIKVELVIDSQNNQINSIEALNTATPFSISSYSNQTWSLLEESDQIMYSNDRALVFYNYQTDGLIQNLYIEGDYYTRRFFYYKNDEMIIATPFHNDLILEEQSNFGVTYKNYSKKLIDPLLEHQSAQFRIKNCQDCILLLTVQPKKKKTSFMITSISDENFTDIQFQYYIYSNFIQITQNQYNSITALKFDWDYTNIILDPYKYNDTYWIPIAFPYKEEMSDNVPGLFYLINAKDPSIYHILKTDDDTLNSRNTGFIVANFENQNTQELIGMDWEGKIYVFNIKTLQLKDSFDFDICKQATVGNIFYYNSGKKLIVACNRVNVYSFDLQTKKFQNLKQLSGEPPVLLTYQDPPMIIMNNLVNGEAYFFKYDSVADKFNQFFTISPGKFRDKIVMIDLLKDNSLWIQYRTSHLFYDFARCIKDPDSCKQCTQQYYFNITNEYKNRLYGSGNGVSPYTSSRNYIIAMIKKHNKHLVKNIVYKLSIHKNSNFLQKWQRNASFFKILFFQNQQRRVSIRPKNFWGVGSLNQWKPTAYFSKTKNSLIFYKQNQAQQYKDAILGSSNINVNINILPDNIMELNKNIIDFSFTSIISLNLTSSDQNKVANIQCQGEIILQNYNKINLQNINLNYTIDKGHPCGLQLINIKEKVEINNIYQYSPTSQNCQKIIINNSILDILKYEIINYNFGDSKYIISTLNSNQFNIYIQFQINISNLQLKGCTISEDFQILYSQTNIDAYINNLQLINNKCSQILDNNLPPTSLFAAGNFNVKVAKITQNIFCSQSIFSTIALLSHLDQQFEFHDIEIFDNEFQTKINYFLFNAFYTMISQPSHSLLMNRIHFKNNTLNKKKNQIGNFMIPAFIQTDKIAKISLNTIILENHSDIQFCFLKQVTSVDFNNFQCISDQDYFDTFINQDGLTSSCIEIKEANLVTINGIKIDKKKTYNNPLFVLENSQIEQSVININNGEFTNLQLNQIKTNSYVSPIFVRSRYNIEMNMKKCEFNNNILLSNYSSKTFSTTGVWVESYEGKVDIQDSSFKNSFSNSTYNFIYIQSDLLQFNKVNFQNSSFSVSDLEKNLNKYTFIQNGGMMNIQVKKLIINDSFFSQSTASQGSFIYAQTFSDNLEINIKQTTFSEGYSYGGGAFFIEASSHLVNINCDSCRFNNIYTLLAKGSAININQFSKNVIDKKNKITFINGSIKNIHGNSDNYFIQVLNSDITFKDIPEILSENFKSTTIPHLQYLNSLNQQQSSFISITDSNLNINNCQFSNLKLNDNKSELSLLVNSQNSNVNFYKTTVKNCTFQQSVLKAEFSSTITLQSTNFLNVSQTQQKRHLSAIINNELLSEQASSLIIAINSILKVFQSSFQDIQCTSNCNGGVFQIINGKTIELQNSKIDSTQGLFGGALFIHGLYGTSFIQDMIFSNSVSQYDGGAVFLKTLQENKFNLLIKNTTYQNNNSKKGNGGALFIISDILNPINQVIDIIGSTFSQNSAILGAAIYQKNISVIDSDSKFTQNKAEKFGNNKLSYPTKVTLLNQQKLSIYHEVKIDQIIIEIQNFRSGDLIKNIQFHIQDGEDEIFQRNKDSEEILDLNVRVGNNIKNSSSYNIRGNFTASYDETERIFSFSDLTIVGTPGSETIIEFYSDQIYTFNKTYNNFTKGTYSYQIKIGFRQCKMGEQKKEYNDLTECEICESGQYSYENKQCQDCPVGATCLGGVDVKTKYGYWRNSNQSDIILSCHNQEENCKGGVYGDETCYEGHIGALCEECDVNNQNHVIFINYHELDSNRIQQKDLKFNSEFLFQNQQKEKFQNHLQLIIQFIIQITILYFILKIYGEYWGLSYAKSGKYSCQRCDQIKYNIWFVLLITLWFLVSMTLAIKSSLERIKERVAAFTLQRTLKKNTYQNKVRSKNNSKQMFLSPASQIPIQVQNQLKVKTISEPDNTLGIYIKLFTNYMQIVGSIATFNLSIPSGMLLIFLHLILFLNHISILFKGIFELPQAVGEPLKQTMNSLDCALEQINTDIPIIYLRIIFSFLIPVIYLLIFLIGLAIYQLINKKSKLRIYILSTTVIFIIIYVQPDLVSQIIAMLSCRKIGDTSYILLNVSFVCNTEEHMHYSIFLGVPLLLLWIFILPGILFYVLYKNKNNLDSTEIKLKYGYLYKEYKNRAFYWEFVKMAEKILIILSLNFYSQFIIIKGVLVYVIILTYGILSIYIQPYQEKEINDIDSRSTYVCAATVLLGLFIYSNTFNYLVIISIILMVSINLWFISQILQKILVGYFQKIKQIFLPILERLQQKIPVLAKLFNINNNKKMDPIIKEKMKNLFSIYLNKTKSQKKKFIMKILKQQLAVSHEYIFRTPSLSEQEQNSCNSLKDNNPNNKFNNKLKDINQQHSGSLCNYPSSEKVKVILQTSEGGNEKNGTDIKSGSIQKYKNSTNKHIQEGTDQFQNGEEEIVIVNAITEQDNIDDVQVFQSPLFNFDKQPTNGEQQQQQKINGVTQNGFQKDEEIKNEDVLIKFADDTLNDIPQDYLQQQNPFTLTSKSNTQILIHNEYTQNSINSNQNIKKV